MSETSTQSSNRRRSRGGRRRSNRGGQGKGRGQANRGGQKNRGGQGNRGGRRRRAPKPPPLTWWQKLLKAIGLYKPGKKTAAKSGGRKAAPKSNTRIATGTPKERPAVAASGPPVEPVPVETPRLYVGNLSYDANEQDLEELFKGFGSVRSVEIVYNRRTHRSKGYAFVVMHHLDDAKRAVEVLHDQPFMGRKMIVNGAKSDGPPEEDESED